MNTPSKEDLQKEYNQADASGRAMLERLHGKETFASNDYTNLKTFGDCCRKLNIDIDDTEIILHPSLDKYADFIQATLESAIIRDAIANNEEVKLGERRYWPYFYDKSGVGFSFGVTDCDGDSSDIGSRLEFSKKEQCDYFGTQFLEIHKRRIIG